MAYEYKTQPWAHQRVALNLSASKVNFALFMGTGTGKTKVVLDTAAYQWSKGWIDTLLVLAPNGVHEQWIEEEVPLHLPDWVEYDSAFYRAGTVNARLRDAMEWAKVHKDGLLIVAFNIESISHKSGLRAVNDVLKKRRALTVVDESHKIKTPSSSRTRNAWKIARASVARRVLTATNVGKGYEDLYAQMMFLGENVLGYHTFSEFKANHCILAGEYNDIVGYRNVEDLMAKIAKVSFTVERKDCADIKEPLWMQRKVPLTDEQRRIIKDLTTQYATQLPSGEIIEAELAIQRLQKLQQIAGGHVSLGNGKWEAVANHSIGATLDLLEELPGKVVIWCEWTPDIIQLSAALTKERIPFVTYYGENSARTNSENKTRFKTDPRIRVFLSNPAAGGAGLNLPEADNDIFYTIGFDAIEYWQALGRIDRGMNPHQKTHHTLVRPGTADQKVLASLRKKENLAATLRDPKVFKTWLQDISANL